jgi:hypothetical protein
VTLVSNGIPNVNLSNFRTGTLTVTANNVETIPGGFGTDLILAPQEPGSLLYPFDPNMPVSVSFLILPTGGAAAVPEPASLTLWGLAGVSGLGWLARRWKGRPR